jgi:hypothetical protein
MLRVEYYGAANTRTLRMQGRLAGAFAEEVRVVMARCRVRERRHPRESLPAASLYLYLL